MIHEASSDFSHWDATQTEALTSVSCTGKLIQVSKEKLRKMKIFSRFHYVWYLVSACWACNGVTLPMSTRVVFGFIFLLQVFSHLDRLFFLSWKCNLYFLCVVLLLFVWNFRRWQSLTFYQILAAFVPGGRPLYVVDALTSIWCLCCNPTCLSPSSPRQHMPENCIAVFV